MVIYCPTLVSPWSTIRTKFLRQDLFNVKGPQLSEIFKNEIIKPRSNRGPASTRYPLSRGMVIGKWLANTFTIKTSNIDSLLLPIRGFSVGDTGTVFDLKHFRSKAQWLLHITQIKWPNDICDEDILIHVFLKSDCKLLIQLTEWILKKKMWTTIDRP